MPNIGRLISEFPARIRAQAAANGVEAAALIEARLKDALSRPYPRASRPGEVPAKRSGRLQRETYAQSRVVGKTVVITAASPTPYAQSLVARGRIWIKPVIDASRRTVEDLLLRKGYAKGSP